MIRRLTSQDVSAFRRVWQDGLKRFPGAFLLTEAEAAAVPEENLIAAMAEGTHWGAFQEASLVAIATMRRGGPTRLRHTADIGPFYVLPVCQGKGIAQDLLDTMLSAAQADGLLQVELCVDATNQRAISLYERAGFERFGVRPRSVVIDGVGRDDILMMCNLDSRPA